MSDSELAGGAGRDRRGVSRIGDARSQDRVTVTGTICETQTVTLGGSLAYRCVLCDGTGQLDLLFLGRAAVAGLAVGPAAASTAPPPSAAAGLPSGIRDTRSNRLRNPRPCPPGSREQPTPANRLTRH